MSPVACNTVCRKDWPYVCWWETEQTQIYWSLCHLVRTIQTCLFFHLLLPLTWRICTLTNLRAISSSNCLYIWKLPMIIIQNLNKKWKEGHEWPKLMSPWDTGPIKDVSSLCRKDWGAAEEMLPPKSPLSTIVFDMSKAWYFNCKMSPGNQDYFKEAWK